MRRPVLHPPFLTPRAYHCRYLHRYIEVKTHRASDLKKLDKHRQTSLNYNKRITRIQNALLREQVPRGALTSSPAALEDGVLICAIRFCVGTGGPAGHGPGQADCRDGSLRQARE
jgi:hypothetical protein